MCIRDRFEYNLVAPLFALNLALSEPPSYQATTDDSDLEQAFMTILGLGHDRQFDEILGAHQRGAMPSTVMWGAVPTRFDSTQAPPGFHTAFMWEKLPYRLGGDPDSWDRVGREHGRAMLDAWTSSAPNLAESVIDWFVRTPRDTVRSLPNMREGELLVGAFANDQVGFHRPFPGAGHYRSGIEGLYLCGGSCHPGGNITGLCGYNAAGVVMADLGATPWWSPVV